MKIAVIGYGSIGKRHLKNLLKIPQVEIIVCTSKKNLVIKNKKCIIVNSVDECIKHKPDAVIISNVTSNHVQTALKFAKHNCDLFIEKPLSNSSNNVKRLYDVIKKKKIISMMGCPLRFHPCIKKVKDMISKKEIGRVIFVQVENGSYLPDWHPEEDYKKGYSARDELGGGVVLTCIHELDYLYWIFGYPTKIYAHVGQYSDLKISSEDYAITLLQFKKKIMAEIHLDFFQRPKSRFFKLVGTKGTIYCDLEKNVVKIFNIKNQEWVQSLKLNKYDINKMYQEEIVHFIHSTRKRKITINPINDGIQTLKIANNAKRISRSKGLQRLK